MDATGCPGPAQAAPAGCAAPCAMATALLGIPGLLVTAVTVAQDGWTVAEVVTGPGCEAARRCPECGRTATRVKERPRTAPRDVLIGDRQILLCWRKTRWHCDGPGCEQGTFTEALHKDKVIGSFDAAVIDQEDGKPHVVKRMDRPGVRVIPEWFGGGTLPRKELHELAEQLTASQAGLIAVGEPTIEKALDKALTNADKVVKRTMDATTDEIASELQEALKG